MNKPTLLSAALLSALLANGCGQSQRAPVNSDINAQNVGKASAANTANDPCRLLDPAEVEAVLGSPLAGPPFRAHSEDQSGSADAEGKYCWYVAPDFRNVVIDFDGQGGASSLQMYGAFFDKPKQGSKGLLQLQDGSTLAGEWDEARVIGGNQFMALRGDSVVTIHFGGAGIGAAEVAKLADAAVRRFDHPLSIDGAAGIVAADAHERLRPKPVPACELFDRAIVETALGKVIKGPDGQDNAKGEQKHCDALYLDASGKQHSFSADIEAWRDGFAHYHDDIRITDGIFRNAVKDAGGAEHASKDLGKGPWDAAARMVDGEVAIVKRDVYVKVWVQRDDLQRLSALMTNVYAKLQIADTPPATH